MEQVQPVYYSTNNTLRFYKNSIVDYLAENRLNDIAVLKHSWDISLDDVRQFHQLIGYSVSGYLGLSICYTKGSYDLDESEGNYYDDYYADYICGLDVSENPKHPTPQILEDGTYRPNKLIQKIVEHWNLNVESILNTGWPIEDKRQFAQLLGFHHNEVERRWQE